MRQAKGEDEPPLQPATDATQTEEVEDKPVTGEEETTVVVVAVADVGAADPLMVPSSPEGTGLEEDGEGRSGHLPVDAVGETVKLENRDGAA
jgi:hypothetical protein